VSGQEQRKLIQTTRDTFNNHAVRCDSDGDVQLELKDYLINQVRDDLTKVVLSHTISNIHEKEWKDLAGTEHVKRSYGWYRTEEDSHLKANRYVFVREHDTLVGVACCFLSNERVLGFDISYLEVKSFFFKGSDQVPVLVEGLERTRVDDDLDGIILPGLQKEEADFLVPFLEGFTPFQLEDATYIDLDFETFDDYLNSLDEQAWRSARMTLNRARKWKIQTVFTHEFSKWKQTAHRLQSYVCEEHNDFQYLLPEEFYDVLEKNAKQEVELVLLFKDDIPLVFALAANSPQVSHYKYTGIDPKYKKYHAYFLLYYKAIEKAIERNQKRIYFGVTNYEFKEKIGCKRVEQVGFARFANPVLHAGFKAYSSFRKLQ
jgi:predicted N-acyltransferase